MDEKNKESIALPMGVKFPHEGKQDTQDKKDENLHEHREDSTSQFADTSETIDGLFIGFFINYGITSWRLFEVPKDTSKDLKEIKAEAYKVSDPNDEDYLPCIIETTKSIVSEIGEKYGNQLFIKAFVDYSFSEIFKTDKQLSDFTQRFYKETHLCFNIISQAQTRENLTMLFGDLTATTAIINIGSLGVDILVKNEKEISLYNIPIKLADVVSFIKKKRIEEEWSEENITTIKTYIKTFFPPKFKDARAKDAIIIKGEYSFMKEKGYKLKMSHGRPSIDIDTYKECNRSLLFFVDYHKNVQELDCDDAEKQKKYWFKIGHIVIETIFDSLKTEKIYPNDKLSIHGNSNAYIFNVVVGGSMNGEHSQNMYDACLLMKQMGAEVMSPIISDGKLLAHTNETDYEHACAIRDCDLLFVSNKDGYFGEQTRQQIYGAFLLKKPIAFWVEPSEEQLEHLTFIPYEQWQRFMKVLEAKAKEQ